MHKVAVFMGTRPEAIKMAPVIKALEANPDLEPIVVSTGQHKEMLKQVVDLFDLKVDHDLEVMQPNQTLASLTSRLMARIDTVFDKIQPDFALVQGDTTTVLVAALACFYRRIPIGHVEAGLRTGNIYSPFPEEANRKLATPLVTLHFPPTAFGQKNLIDEGIDDGSIFVTGNTVIDALHLEVERQKDPGLKKQIRADLASEIGDDWDQSPYVLITGHRRENFGGGFEQICDALVLLADKYPGHNFIYPVHLNPNVQTIVHEKLGGRPNIRLTGPKDYRLFVALMNASHIVLTDSGGVQEEAPGLGKPVLVMRDTTERPEGVDAGTVQLIGANRDKIVAHVSELIDDPAAYRRMSEAQNPYGDGQASPRICRAIREYLAGA
jgi:UDP-N-acetylglucosamine 2-epimerase (non-hydrolysing)